MEEENKSLQTKQTASTGEVIDKHNEDHSRLIYRSFSGPLPPPEVLANYERILPGAAERIFVLTEQQSKHRRDLEKRVILSDIWNSRLGLGVGFVLSIFVIWVGYKIILSGQSLVGLSLVIGDLTALILALIYGVNSRQKEQKQNKKDLEDLSSK